MYQFYYNTCMYTYTCLVYCPHDTRIQCTRIHCTRMQDAGDHHVYHC